MTTAWTPSTEYGGCCGIYDDSMNTFHWIRWMLWYIWRQHEHLPLNTVDAVVYMTTAWTPSTEYGGCCGIYDDSMNTFHWIRWMLWYIWRQHEHLPLNTVDAVVYMTAWTPSTEYCGCCGIYDDSMNTFHWIRWMLWYIWRQHEHLPLNTVDAVVYITTAWTPSTEYGGCCGIYDDSINTFHWIRWMLWYISRQHEHLPPNTVDAVVYMTTAWTPSTEYGGCCGIYDDSMNTFHWIRWMLWYIWRQHEHLPLNTVDAVVYMTTAWTPSTEYGGCCSIYDDNMNTFHWIRWMLWYIWRQHEHLPLNTVDAVVYMTTAWTPSTEYGGCCGIYDDSMNTFHWIRWMLWYIWRQHEHLPLNTVDAVVYMTTAWTPSTEYGGCCGIYDDSMNTFHWIRWMLWYIWRQHEHLPLNTVDAVVYMTTAWTPSTEYGGCCGIYDDNMNTFHWIRWMLWYISRQHEHLPLNTVDAVVYMTTAWTPSTEYGGCCGIYDDSMNTFHWIRWMLWYIWRQHEHLPLNTVDAVVYMTTAWTPSTEYGGCCGIYDDSMNTFHWIRWMLWYIGRQHEHLPLNTVDAVVYMTTAWTPSTEYGGCCGIYDDSMNTFHWIRWMLWYIWRQHEHLPLNTVDAVVYMTTAWTPSTEYGGCCGIYDDSMNTFHGIRWMLWYIWRQHEHLPLNTVDAVVCITTAWTPSTEYGGCCGIYHDSMNIFHWIRWMLWYIWRQHEHLPLNTVDVVVYMTAWTPSTEYGGCCGIYDDSMNTFHWIRWMLWYI